MEKEIGKVLALTLLASALALADTKKARELFAQKKKFKLKEILSNLKNS